MIDSEVQEQNDTFISSSVSARGNTGQPTCTGDPILGTKLPAEFSCPSFPRPIFRLTNILSLLHSKSLADGDDKFCCA